MKPQAANPAERLSLHSLGILDGPQDSAVEFIINSVCEILGVPVCLVSIIDDAQGRQYFLASVGLDEENETARETPLSFSICQHVRDANAYLCFDDTENAPLLAKNLAVEKLNAKSYAGTPILGPDARAIGALCAIDHVPRTWSERDRGYLEGFADLVTRQIALRASLETIRIIAGDFNN